MVKINSSPSTHLILVVDRSGSMSSIEREAEQMLLEQIKTARNNNVTVSIYTFDHVVENPIYQRDVNTLNANVDIKPRGWTAMLDAVGTVVSQARVVEDLYDRTLVVIISDGEENSSKFETWRSVADKIKAATATGKYTFSYLGANQDLAGVAERINIPTRNSYAWTNDRIGTRTMSSELASASVNYYASGATSAQAFMEGDNEEVSSS